MSYGRFVGALSKGLEDHILAYDSRPRHGGCVLRMRKPQKSIFIEAVVIDREWDDALSLLRAKILEGGWEAPCMRLSLHDGNLVFEVEEEISQAA